MTKNNLEKKVYLANISQTGTIIEGSQGSNLVMSRGSDHGEMGLPGLLLDSCSATFLTEPHFTPRVTAQAGWAFPYQSAIKQMP